MLGEVLHFLIFVVATSNIGLQVGAMVSAFAALLTAAYAVWRGQRGDRDKRLELDDKQKLDLTSLAVTGQASLITDLQEEVARLRTEVQECESARAGDRERLERMESQRIEDLKTVQQATITMESYRAEVAMLRRQLDHGQH